MALQVFVRDDLVQVGLTEDGEADLARRFYLVVEAPSGARWAHDYARTAHVGGADRAAAFVDALRRRVDAHLAAGGRLDPAHWNAIDPCYGSEAYQELDAVGFFKAHEVLREVDRGERISREAEEEARFWAAAGELQALPAA